MIKTIIFLHGWGADAAVWQKQTQAFQARFEVQAPAISTWDPAWLEEYLKKFSLADCLLVGWSLGGMLLLEVLARQSAAVGGLVLAGAAPVFCSQADHPWGQPPAAVRAMRRALKSNPKKVLQDFAGSCLAPGEEAFQGETAALFSGGNAADLATGLDYLLNQDLRPLLPHFPAPPVIIQGSQDRIVPPEQGRFLHEHLPGSSLHLLKGAGHLPFWTKAERFNEILEKIVDREPES
ncbi:MAG: alpha/beta fold hydrolase [Deltaproteobacteria bacterium]|nr:MAG: alpha/beta fold hydrolase [Deltaproteobacteria bacterium]